MLLSMVFCLPVSASAQEKKPEQLTAAILTLERKRDADFEAAIKKHLDFRLKGSGIRMLNPRLPASVGDMSSSLETASLENIPAFDPAK